MTEPPDCRRCGICCVTQFVPLYPSDMVPIHLVGYEPAITNKQLARRMRQEHGRCAALRGQVGIDVSCSIYEQRPKVCRALLPGSDACQTIRENWGPG